MTEHKDQPKDSDLPRVLKDSGWDRRRFDRLGERVGASKQFLFRLFIPHDQAPKCCTPPAGGSVWRIMGNLIPISSKAKVVRQRAGVVR
ncbi:MAG: hypothetical protein ACREP5_00105, partial [Candidatus Binatia bacterium]